MTLGLVRTCRTLIA